MAKWIFLKDFDVAENYEQVINLAFVTHFTLRIEDLQLVAFLSGSHDDPHVLTFKSRELCQKAYDQLSAILKAEM